MALCSRRVTPYSPHTMGLGLFWRQFWILVWKNLIVLSKNPFVRVYGVMLWLVETNLSQLNIVRCLLLPIGYAVFLSFAQFILHKPNNVSANSLELLIDSQLATVWPRNLSTHSSSSRRIRWFYASGMGR